MTAQNPQSHAQCSRHLPVRPNQSSSLLVGAQQSHQRALATVTCHVESGIADPEKWRIEGGRMSCLLRAESPEMVVE